MRHLGYELVRASLALLLLNCTAFVAAAQAIGSSFDLWWLFGAIFVVSVVWGSLEYDLLSNIEDQRELQDEPEYIVFEGPIFGEYTTTDAAIYNKLSLLSLIALCLCGYCVFMYTEPPFWPFLLLSLVLVVWGSCPGFVRYSPRTIATGAPLGALLIVGANFRSIWLHIPVYLLAVVLIYAVAALIPPFLSASDAQGNDPRVNPESDADDDGWTKGSARKDNEDQPDDRKLISGEVTPEECAALFNIPNFNNLTKSELRIALQNHVKKHPNATRAEQLKIRDCFKCLDGCIKRKTSKPPF